MKTHRVEWIDLLEFCPILRLRFTIRRMMLAVAVVAALLWVVLAILRWHETLDPQIDIVGIEFLFAICGLLIIGVPWVISQLITLVITREPKDGPRDPR